MALLTFAAAKLEVTSSTLLARNLDSDLVNGEQQRVYARDVGRTADRVAVPVASSRL